MSHSTHVGFNEPPIGVSVTAICWRGCRWTTRPSNPLSGTFMQDCDDPSFQSLAVGVGQVLIATTVSRFGNRFTRSGALSTAAGVIVAPIAEHARGVGHDPDAFPQVGSANVCRRNNSPLRIIPERGQVAENVSKPPSKQSCDVFHKHVSRSYLANEPGVFAPQAGTLSGKAGAFAGVGQVLAGETAAYDIGPRSHFGQPIGRHGLNIVMNGHLGPMLCQHLPAERVYLAKCDSLETAGPFKAEAEAADAGKKIKDLELHRKSSGLSPAAASVLSNSASGASSCHRR